MLITFEAADLNLDFLSVRILCSTFARTDSQETLLVLDLELQSCNNVAAVRYVGASRSSDWKSRYLIRSRVMSGISDLRASNRNSGPGLMVEHFSRACSRLSISPTEHERHRGEGAFDMFILWSLSCVGRISCSILHRKERITGDKPGTQTARQDLPQSMTGASRSALHGTSTEVSSDSVWVTFTSSKYLYHIFRDMVLMLSKPSSFAEEMMPRISSL